MSDTNFDFDAQSLAASNLLDEDQLLALNLYQDDLRVYSAQKNKAIRDAVEKKILEKYRPILGFNSTDIKCHAALLDLTDDNEEDKTYTLKDILEMQDELPSWLVPNLIGAGGGLYIVAGAPKTGKTLLFTYQLAYSVAFSGEFLGFPVPKGPVIIFECEESLSKIARTFRSKGLSKFNEEIINQEGHEDQIIIRTDFAIDAESNLLKDLVNQYKPSLIIFDSLRKITSHLDVSENSADFSKHLYKLQKTLNYLQVPGVIIHHLNKGAKEKGIEGVSGSLSIAGASDGIILLYREEGSKKNENNHTIELSTIPREGLPVHWVINRTKPKAGFWTYAITEDLGVDPDQLRMERRILRFMSTHPGTIFTRVELAQKISQDPDAFIYQNAINRLIDSLQIAEEQLSGNEFGVWINAGSPWSNIADVRSPMAEDFEIADRLIAATTTEEAKAITEGWSPEYKQKIWSMLSDEERVSVLKLTKPAKFATGDWVVHKETEEKHQIKEPLFEPAERTWSYVVEGDHQFPEDELEISLDYSVNYGEKF
jgi:KaiC/GvpD/RAD55 family RecA-like ATPase